MAILNLLKSKNVAKLSENDLGEEEVFNSLQTIVVDYDKGGDVGDAQQLLINLSQVLAKNSLINADNPNLYKRYQDLILRLKWICMPVLVDNDIEELFRNHLFLAIGKEVNFQDKLEGLFNIYKDTESLGYKRLLVLRGLRDNKEKLGEMKINIGERGESSLQTIENWLKDYDQFAPTDRYRGALSQESYLSQNKNVKRLNSDERKILREIIKLYDYLRRPEISENIVAPTGHIIPSELPVTKFEPAIIRPKPEFTPPTVLVQEPAAAQKAPTSPEALAAEIQQIYLGPPKLQKRIAKEEEWLQKVVAGDSQKLRTEFYNAVQRKNVNKTIAAFRLLAELNELDKFLQQDEKIRRFLLSVWPKLYGPQVATELKNNPGSWQTVKYFVKYILQQRLGLPASEAARIGAQLGNVFKKVGREELSKLAYFDLETKSFKWLE